MTEQENPATRLARETLANTEKVIKATQLFAKTRDDDVSVGVTPKKLVMRRDKVELFPYAPLAQQTVSTPVLVAYGLVGRYTMADLQPDRSLIRSLLNKGLDLWLIDWGQPGRNERWLTIDDYVDDYIDAAVDKFAPRQVMTRSRCLGSAKEASLPSVTRPYIRRRSAIWWSLLRQSTFTPTSMTRLRTTGSSICGPEVWIRKI